MEEITAESILSRYMCKNLCQVTPLENKKCIECGSPMDYIGDFNEEQLEKKIRELQLEKLKHYV